MVTPTVFLFSPSIPTTFHLPPLQNLLPRQPRELNTISTSKNLIKMSSYVGLAASATVVMVGVASATEYPLLGSSTLQLSEPENALSLPTWAIHVSSVVEWVLAMALVWEYGEKSGHESWKGLSWGMIHRMVLIRFAMARKKTNATMADNLAKLSSMFDELVKALGSRGFLTPSQKAIFGSTTNLHVIISKSNVNLAKNDASITSATTSTAATKKGVAGVESDTIHTVERSTGVPENPQAGVLTGTIAGNGYLASAIAGFVQGGVTTSEGVTIRDKGGTGPLSEVPLLGGAFCACTWHFFYNSDSLSVLVALQAALTVIGNFTMCIAAFRIYKSSQESSEKL
ncbi:hypothetical protein GIB67_040681 [Kingdonia uniflora]|uniref:Uncharacterized protein n=1 Tax=Kingdonia uniflora TaxID=39325 RepID=A0A7J7KUB8_9MAGN|nr:hypothetical protein GIB67_040681 [Kingdonia uniflora]